MILRKDAGATVAKQAPMGRRGGAERAREDGQPSDRKRKAHPPCPPRPPRNDLGDAEYLDASDGYEDDDLFFDMPDTLHQPCKTLKVHEMGEDGDGEDGQPSDPKPSNPISKAVRHMLGALRGASSDPPPPAHIPPPGETMEQRRAKQGRLIDQIITAAHSRSLFAIFSDFMCRRVYCAPGEGHKPDDTAEQTLKKVSRGILLLIHPD